MPTIELITEIDAPIERVFDLARSLDLHMDSMAQTGERAVAGVTSGLIDAGQEVTWQARHFGVWQHLTSRITVCDRPTHFADTMVRGAFKRFDHDHYFTVAGSGGKDTMMRDVFDFDAPLGPLGWLAERLFLTRYMRNLLLKRNATFCAVGALNEQPKYNNQELIMHRRTLAGSLIGSIKETQDVLDFCAEHDIAPDVQVIDIQDVNDAYKKVKNEDVRFRYVIDMASLKREMDEAA